VTKEKAPLRRRVEPVTSGAKKETLQCFIDQNHYTTTAGRGPPFYEALKMLGGVDPNI
jgi:hypothetical protein